MEMIFTGENLLKLGLALLVGGLIGLERESRDKAAGFRTLIFICMGATLFTILSSQVGSGGDPGRIAAGIVIGVGFLGAGAILHEHSRITGLTTAATIWLVAALGMGIGGGQYALVGVGVILTLVVLWLFPYLEGWINRLHDERHYVITCAYTPERIKVLAEIAQQSGLHLRGQKIAKSGLDVICNFQLSGSKKAHERLTAYLFTDAEVKEFYY